MNLYLGERKHFIQVETFIPRSALRNRCSVFGHLIEFNKHCVRTLLSLKLYCVTDCANWVYAVSAVTTQKII
jgi:hypothetical protein